MNPEAKKIWQAPQWAFAALLAILGMLGPFSIDTYLPAFAGVAHSLGASPVEMQQTLSAYMFGFAFMSLFHGSLSDSVGRRPVVLWGLAVFSIASGGCALSSTVGQLILFRTLQGLSTGAGIVVARAVVRDMYAPSQAQKVMSQITLFFGVAPALAPLLGGILFTACGWRSIFWFLMALGAILWIANYRWLPETLHAKQRHPFELAVLWSGYRTLALDPRFLLLALCSGVPFNGMFIYVLSAPVFLGTHLGLPPAHFFWFFVLTISGMMLGAWMSGRCAGRHAPAQQIRVGLQIMLGMGLVNWVVNTLWIPDVRWAMFPIAVFAYGWARMVSVVTLLLLDLYPQRRGMASSLHTFVSALSNGLVAGVLSPWVMHSPAALALASFLLMLAGALAWWGIRYFWPAMGQSVIHME